MDPTTQLSIQSQFESNSEISLPNFLKPEKYNMVAEALREISGYQKSWKMVGPANKRRYDRLIPLEPVEDMSRLHKVHKLIGSCVKFLNSDATFLLLSNLTGLHLHPLASEVLVDSPEGYSKKPNDISQDRKENVPCSKSKSEFETRGLKSSNENATIDTNMPAGAHSEQGALNENKIYPTEGKCTSKCKAEVRRWRQVRFKVQFQYAKFGIFGLIYILMWCHLN